MLTTALAPAATTTPVSNSRAAVQPPSPRASANTSRVVPRAPTVALASISTPLIPSSIADSAATAAPPETPMTNGSASGLRSRTCISTPASANTPPAANAVSVRGRRSSKTSVWESASVERKPCHSSAMLMSTLPLISDTTNAASAITSERGADRGHAADSLHGRLCRFMASKVTIPGNPIANPSMTAR